MKVVGIGLNKTGTTTLGICFWYLGFQNISFRRKTFELWQNGDIKRLLTWIERYDSFEDWPWPLIYKEIDNTYPDTKYILTRRSSSDRWFESLCNWADKTGPTIYRKSIYGHEMPHDHEREHKQYYENHLRSVRDYFKKRPKDFLEVCREEGHGWGELSSFLGIKAPNIKFPHANKS